MIEVELDTEELEKVLLRIGAALDDKTALMGEMGQYMAQTTQDRIQRGEQPDGQPFAPRSQTTVDLYARQGKSFGEPLNQAGRMRRNIAFNADADGVDFGSNAIQAAVMQFGAAQGSLGSGAPWGDIPARPFLGVSDDDQVALIDIVAEYLESAARD